jgi:hypothetical protein
MNEPKYIWDYNLFKHTELNINPSAIYLLKQFPELIKPFYLSYNPYAFDLINEYIDDIYLDMLSANPCAIKILEKRPELIKWRFIVKNPNATHIIKNNLDKIDRYSDLGSNPNALDFLDHDKLTWFQLLSNPLIDHEYIEHENRYNLIYKGKIVQWFRFVDHSVLVWVSQYPNATHIIEKHIKHINWCMLSCNPNAIHILEKYPEKINWYNLCANPNAISLIEKNIHNLDGNCWNILSGNPNALHLICKYDYELMKQNYKKMNEELVQYVMNPTRLIQISTTYDIPFIELVEIYG